MYDNKNGLAPKNYFDDIDYKYFYILSPEGQLFAYPSKIGVCTTQKHLKERIRYAKTKYDDRLELAVIYEYVNDCLVSSESGFPNIRFHTAIDLERKIKALINNDYTNEDGLYLPEISKLNPSQIISAAMAFEESRTPENAIDNHFKPEILYKGLSVAMMKETGSWYSVGLVLTEDSDKDVKLWAEEVARLYRDGHGIEVIDIYSPTLSYIHIPPAIAIIRVSTFTQVAMSFDDLKNCYVSYINDLQLHTAAGNDQIMLNNRRSLLSYRDENLAEKHVILWDDYYRAKLPKYAADANLLRLVKISCEKGCKARYGIIEENGNNEGGTVITDDSEVTCLKCGARHTNKDLWTKIVHGFGEYN